MGKILTLPSWMSASQVASAADVGTVTDNANGTITVTNVKVSTVKTVLGETTNSVSTLCKSANINGWSHWSPLTMSYDSVNMAFTFTAKTSQYNLGDFAAYNHQAENPVFTSANSSIYKKDLTGYVNISSTAALKEIDWSRKYISGKLFNYVWVECENTVDGITFTKRASAQIGGTTGSIYATVLDVQYKFSKNGSDGIVVRTFLGDSTGPLVKLYNTSGSLTWTYTVIDGNPYFVTFDFDEATASGSFNSANQYFINRANESITQSNKFWTADLQIQERLSSGSVVGRNCTSNNIYISYTDTSSVARTELAYSNLGFSSTALKTASGYLTYTPKDNTYLTLVVKNAVLS